MKVTHAILNYLNENKDSSPLLQKLGILLDLQVSATQSSGTTSNTLQSGIENGEMGLKLMATFSFITQQLILYFYGEFVYLYTLIRKIFKEKKAEYSLIFVNENLLKYILEEHSVFNFWDVYQIAKVMMEYVVPTDSIKYNALNNLKEEFRENFKKRFINGIDGLDNSTTQDNKNLRKGKLFDLVLADVLSNLKTLHIISILSNPFPKERDDMMKFAVEDPNNYYTHTSSFDALTGFLLKHETLGSKSLIADKVDDSDDSNDKYTNMQNTALIVVSEREAMLVSSHHHDKLLTFIMSCGNINRGNDITEKKCVDIKNKNNMVPFNMKYIDALIDKWKNERECLYPSDGIITTITHNKPTLALLVFPISSSDTEMFAMWKQNYNYEKYYMQSYNSNYLRLRDLYEHLQLNNVDLREKYKNALNVMLDLCEKEPGILTQLKRSNSTIVQKRFRVKNKGSISDYYYTFFKGIKQSGDLLELTENEKGVLTNLANSIILSVKNRLSMKTSLLSLYMKEINKEDYSSVFVATEKQNNLINQLGTITNGPISTFDHAHALRRRISERDRDASRPRGGTKINTGIKKSFNGKMKNIYKIKGSNSYYIIYNKKLISVKQYKKELLLNKSKPSPVKPTKQKQSPSPSPVKPTKQKQSPSPSPAKPTKQKQKQKQSPSLSPVKPTKKKQSPSPSPVKPLVDKSNISKYNLRIEQYKNKNLSDYFINKLKTHINDNDDKNNIYKIGIKRIKVILKDIYKINR